MTALACYLVGGNNLAVEHVGQAQVNGQLLLDVAAVVDVISRSIPDAGSVGGHSIALFAADRLDVLELAAVGYLCGGDGILEPIADDYLLYRAVCACNDVDRLVLFYFLFFLFFGVGSLCIGVDGGRLGFAVRAFNGESSNACAAAYEQGGAESDRNGLECYSFHHLFSSLSLAIFLQLFIPSVERMIIPSVSMSSAGRINITHSMLITAPLAMSMHSELIMSISE